MFDQPVIEPAKFARAQRVLAGTLAPALLERLQDQLFDTDGQVTYRVRGYLTERGAPALAVEIGGDIGLRCQRCLGRLAFGLAVQRDIVLVEGADEFEPHEADDAAEDIDVIPLTSRLDLRPLLEEEVLLALPIAPRHADGVCEGAVAAQNDPGSASPFAALAKLKA